MKTSSDIISCPTLNQKGFQIVSINQNNISQYQSGFARAYKDIFNASVWQEGVKCANGCGYKASFEQSLPTCPNCSGEIEDYYSNEEVVNSVLSVIGKTYFQCLLLLKEDAVAGFTWGWKDSLLSINAEKLGLSDIAYSLLLENLTLSDIGPEGDWYYQSETGIVPAFRAQGVGNSLVSINEELIRSNKDKVSNIIQRTSLGSPMYTIRKNLGYTEVFSYDDADNRVLFAKNNS